MVPKKEERNYGIDLLRLFSMFLIVVLHSLGQGGILFNTVQNSIQYKISWFMEICAYCAVNMFGLISGYVSYSDKVKKIKISNYIRIWLEVVFYGILITLLFDLKDPNLISKKDYIITLFPVTNGLYWYFTAYSALFVIMPFLNMALRNCSNSNLKKFFCIIILVFSVFDTIANRFCLNGGYSFVWLVLLYILGAIIKKCKIATNVKQYKIIIGILILCIITYLYKMYGISRQILNVKITNDLLVSYTSPTVLGCAILYLICFSKIKFNNKFKKIIKFVAPTTFSIYILNNHRLVWNNIMKNLMVNIASQSLISIFMHVIGFSILFVIIAIITDKIRLFLFKIFHMEILVTKISDLINFFFDKMTGILSKQ